MANADEDTANAASLACWSALLGYAQLRTGQRFAQLAGSTLSVDSFVDRMLLMVGDHRDKN
jgi:hypothetical protein